MNNILYFFWGLRLNKKKKLCSLSTSLRLCVFAFKFFKFYLFLSFLFLNVLEADDVQKLFQQALEEGVNVDLKNPEIRGTTLSTHEGGVIVAPGIRIQARSITYTRNEDNGEETILLTASGDLMFDYGPYHLIGDSLTYDFVQRTGSLTNGRGGYEIWYFGGTLIEVFPDYSLKVHNLFLTTSDNLQSDWKLTGKTAIFSPNQNINAKNLHLVIENKKVFWLPSFSTNLKTLADNPFRYRLRWGGKQGVRLGVSYLAFDRYNWQTYLRFDYRIQRGPGGGVETVWDTPDGNQHLHTINYIARDSSTVNPKEKVRYRFEGGYLGYYDEKRTSFELAYDYVSDEEMPDDYYDKGLAHKTVRRTHLHLRRQQNQWWIANFSTRMRINHFQTIKQELPYFTLRHHPWEIPKTGIIAENIFSGGYLDFVFSDHKETDFSSARVEWNGKLYRPFHFGKLTATPFVEGVTILYSEHPEGGKSRWLTTGIFGGEIKTSFSKKYTCHKHVVEPYTIYSQVAAPSLTPEEHYIFDVDDGWHSLKSLRYGLKQHIYRQDDCHFFRILSLDLYGYSFYNNKYNPTPLPRLFGEIQWNISPYIFAGIDSCWDLVRHDLGYINTLLKWTWSENFALSTEYRHRNGYIWRKADPHNFMMEASATDAVLSHSILSDHRNTLLFHTFYRFVPNWTADFEYRKGWGREKNLQETPQQRKDYEEYQLDLTTTLRSQWLLRLSWQHREDDHRVVFYISLPNNMP